MSSTDTLYILLFTTGLTIGFGHCIGMCGPIVVSLSLHLKGRSTLLPHILYNTGRILTYGILGGLMGITGSFTRVTAGIESLQKGVMIFAGIIIIMMGLAMSGWVPLGEIFRSDYNPEGLISKQFKKLSASSSTVAYLPLGLLLGLLPCGPVYTALIASARVGMEEATLLGGLFKGMGLMVCFGLGTFPALLLVAKLTDFGWMRKREIIYKIGSVLMMIMGVYLVIQGIRY